MLRVKTLQHGASARNRSTEPQKTRLIERNVGQLEQQCWPKTKVLRFGVYKWHALADYVRAIRLFGGADGFSTQIVSLKFYSILNDSTSKLSCSLVKRFHGLTNKWKVTGQIAKRWRRLEKAQMAHRQHILHLRTQKSTNTSSSTTDNEDEDGDSDLRYHLAPSKNHLIEPTSYLRHNAPDLAYSVSLFV